MFISICRVTMMLITLARANVLQPGTRLFSRKQVLTRNWLAFLVHPNNFQVPS